MFVVCRQFYSRRKNLVPFCRTSSLCERIAGELERRDKGRVREYNQNKNSTDIRLLVLYKIRFSDYVLAELCFCFQVWFSCSLFRLRLTATLNAVCSLRHHSRLLAQRHHRLLALHTATAVTAATAVVLFGCKQTSCFL